MSKPICLHRNVLPKYTSQWQKKNNRHLLSTMFTLNLAPSSCGRHSTLHKTTPLHKPVIVIAFLVLLSFCLLLLYVSYVFYTKSPQRFSIKRFYSRLILYMITDVNSLKGFSNTIGYRSTGWWSTWRNERVNWSGQSLTILTNTAIKESAWTFSLKLNRTRSKDRPIC